MLIQVSKEEREKLAAVGRWLRKEFENTDMQLFGCDRWYAAHRDGTTTDIAMAGFLDGLAERCGDDRINSNIGDQALVVQGGKDKADGLAVSMG